MDSVGSLDPTKVVVEAGSGARLRAPGARAASGPRRRADTPADIFSRNGLQKVRQLRLLVGVMLSDRFVLNNREVAVVEQLRFQQPCKMT